MKLRDRTGPPGRTEVEREEYRTDVIKHPEEYELDVDLERMFEELMREVEVYVPVDIERDEVRNRTYRFRIDDIILGDENSVTSDRGDTSLHTHHGVPLPSVGTWVGERATDINTVKELPFASFIAGVNVEESKGELRVFNARGRYDELKGGRMKVDGIGGTSLFYDDGKIFTKEYDREKKSEIKKRSREFLEL